MPSLSRSSSSESWVHVRGGEDDDESVAGSECSWVAIQCNNSINTWSDIVRLGAVAPSHDASDVRPSQLWKWKKKKQPQPIRVVPEESPCAKMWAKTCQARKYQQFEDGDSAHSTKQCTGSGNTFKHRYHYYSIPSQLRLTKTVRNPPPTSSENHASGIGGRTHFEQSFGFSMLDRYKRGVRPAEISLNKSKLWERVPQALEALADLQFETKCGEVHHSLQPTLGCGGRSCHRVNQTTATFVMLHPKTCMTKMSKEDREMERFVQDQLDHAKLVQPKTMSASCSNVRRMREERHLRVAAIPDGVDAPRLALKLCSNAKNGAGFKLKSARVDADHHQSAWRPASFDDRRDFLEVDLGRRCTVVAVGTKGRATQSLHGWRGHAFGGEEHDHEEWVSAYKLFYKESTEDKTWKPVAEFTANTDSETEVAHTLLSPHTEAPGLVCTLLRFQPTKFHNRKCMRVGVYGVAVASDTKQLASLVTSPQSMDVVISRVVETPSVVFQVHATPSQRQGGKWNYSQNSKGNYTGGRLKKKAIKKAGRKEVADMISDAYDFYRTHDCGFFSGVMTCSRPRGRFRMW
jgi:hypothetical protein